MDYTHKVLVANPNLKDPMFKHSVVYIYQDDESGSYGIILNKPFVNTLGDVCASKGIHAYNHFDEAIRTGGPVKRTAILMLHSQEWASMTTSYIGNELCITSDDAMLGKLASGSEPYNWRIFNGISTWQPFQLEYEINGTEPFKKEESWLVIDADLEYIFTLDEMDQWKRGVELYSQQMVEQYF